MVKEYRLLVVGGLGFIGRKVSENLIKTEKFQISVLETREKLIQNSDTDDLLKNVDYYLFENNKFYLFHKKNFVEKKVPDFNVVIFAIRTRYNTSPDSSFFIPNAISEIESGISSTVLFSLRVLDFIGFTKKKPNERKIINLYSSNAESVSHQPMSYHAVNAMMKNVFQFLAIKLQEYKVQTFQIQIGVISGSSPTNEATNHSRINDATFEDLFSVLFFLISFKGYGLVGESIKLIGSRNLIDVTAGYEGEFGNLQVRN